MPKTLSTGGTLLVRLLSGLSFSSGAWANKEVHR